MEDNKEEKIETVEIEKNDYVDKEGLNEAMIESAFTDGNPDVQPKMFIDVDEKVNIEVDIFSNRKTGKILSVFPKGIMSEEDMSEFKKDFPVMHTTESFEFSVPSFEEISLYRTQSSNNVGRTVDKNVFRSFIIAMHLRDWSLKDETGKKVEIEQEVDGSMSKKSMKYVNRVPVAVWDIVLTALERELKIG